MSWVRNFCFTFFTFLVIVCQTLLNVFKNNYFLQGNTFDLVKNSSKIFSRSVSSRQWHKDKVGGQQKNSEECKDNRHREQLNLVQDTLQRGVLCIFSVLILQELTKNISTTYSSVSYPRLSAGPSDDMIAPNSRHFLGFLPFCGCTE